MIATQNGRAWTLFTVVDPTTRDHILASCSLPERMATTLLQIPPRYLWRRKVDRIAGLLAREHRGCTVYIHQREHRDHGHWDLQGTCEMARPRNASPRKK
jgi:hypothetical protein